MSSQAYADRLSRAVESTGLAEVVKTSFGDNNISVLCRVKQGSDGEWVKIVERILLAEPSQVNQPHAWASHICRRYFLKEFPDGSKMVFGWNLAFQSRDIATSLDFISRVIRGEKARIDKSEKSELDEMPLSGAGPSRGKVYTIGGSNDFKPSR